MRASGSFIEHLEDLRTTLLRSFLWVGLGFFVCWFFHEELFSFLKQPIESFLVNTEGKLIFLSPIEAFLAHLQVSFFAGVAFTMPLWFYEFWKFVSPGLYKNEKSFLFLLVGFGALLFFLGLSFVYFIMFPVAFEFLLAFADASSLPFISLNNYLSFVTLIFLAFGLAFQLPLILVFLGRVGVVTKAQLVKFRRYAIVILALIGALVTPPDVLSLFFMLIPMLLLYELSVFLVGVLEKRN